MTLNNPFTPNDPATPEVFGGRVNELHELCVLLAQVADGKTIKRQILGERGIGKTSLLNYLESYARGQTKYKDHKFDFLVVRLSLTSKTTAMDLLVTLDDGLRKEIARVQKIRQAAQDLWDFVKRWNVLGVEYKGAEVKGAAIIQARQQLAGFIKHLARDILGKNGSPNGLVLILDECDLASPELELGELMKALTEDIGNKASTLVVICGLPTLLEKMNASHPSSVRAFRTIELGRFQQDDIANLINRCMSAQRNDPPVTLSPDAQRLLVALSEGFPHFAQEFGFCAFNETPNERINTDDVTNGASKHGGAIDRIGEAYHFGSLYESLNDAELELVLALGPLALAEEWVSPEKVRNKIKTPKSIDAAVDSLVDKGMLLLNPVNPETRRTCKFRHNAFGYWVKLRESRTQSSWAPVSEIFGASDKKIIRSFDDLREALTAYGIQSSMIADLQKAIKKDNEEIQAGIELGKWTSKLLDWANPGPSARAKDDRIDPITVLTEIIPLINAYLGGGS